MPFYLWSLKFYARLSTINMVYKGLPIRLISLMVSPFILMVCSLQSIWLTHEANLEMTSYAYEDMLEVNIIIS